MMGKSQAVEEGQEKVHDQLQSLLIIQNSKIEELWKFYQGFDHTEKVYLHECMSQVFKGHEYAYHLHNPSQQNMLSSCLADLLSFIYRLFLPLISCISIHISI